MTKDTQAPTEEQVDDFPHDDVLDMRELLDDKDTAPVLIVAMLRDGLATDVDDVHQYAENEPTMIEDGWFVEYAEELADDLGLVDRDARWPASHIDWERAADELRMDYSSVEIAGRIYWVRDF